MAKKAKEKESPKGYVTPSNTEIVSGKLILQPIYLVPLEIFQTSLLSRPQYIHKLAVVEASGGSVEFFPMGKLKIEEKDPPEGMKLSVNLEKKSALNRALMAAEMEGREGWRSFFRSIWPSADESKVSLRWRLWYLDGMYAVDSISSKRIDPGVLLSIIMSSGNRPVAN